MYYFGLYHWRSRLRQVGAGVLGVAVGLAAWRLGRDRSGRARVVAVTAALAATGWGLGTAGRTLVRLLDPPPWRLERAKYDALASVLPLEGAAVVADVGCGTGRSLAGLAPHLDAGTTLLALDVFDDRVILGNGPGLAARNAAVAGRPATAIRGDAGSLPFADGTVDVVTACRVLHDLPRQVAASAVREARRTLRAGGTLGVLELPIPHEAGADPETYWRELLADNGFEVTEQRRHGRYVVLAATPD